MNNNLNVEEKLDVSSLKDIISSSETENRVLGLSFIFNHKSKLTDKEFESLRDSYFDKIIDSSNNGKNIIDDVLFLKKNVASINNDDLSDFFMFDCSHIEEEENDEQQ